MITSSGEFLQDNLPGQGACMLLKLLMEIAKMPPPPKSRTTPYPPEQERGYAHLPTAWV